MTRLQRLIEIVLLGAALLLIACGDGRHPSGSPTVTERVSSTAIPEASPTSPPGASVTITWHSAEQQLFTGQEQDNPFTQQWPQIPAEDLRWSLFVGEVGSQPQKVYESKRRLHQPSWSADGSRLGLRGNGASRAPGATAAVSRSNSYLRAKPSTTSILGGPPRVGVLHANQARPTASMLARSPSLCVRKLGACHACFPKTRRRFWTCSRLSASLPSWKPRVSEIRFTHT